MEYLYPGVYVEEIETVPKPIDGVSVSIDEDRLRSLVAELQQTVSTHLPEWTSLNDSDPGVTLPQLLAWLASPLMYRAEQLPDRGRIWAFRAAVRLFELAGSSARSRDTLRRPSYFSGQMLDATTFQLEQNYAREKRRRHNRLLHGFGIVSGLDVRIVPADDRCSSRVVVEPGYAIDPLGEEIGLAGGASLAIPATDDQAFVTLRFWEHPCPEPSPSELDTPGVTCVEEACVVGLGPLIPESAVPIARLVRVNDDWIVDREFVAPRTAQVPGGD